MEEEDKAIEQYQIAIEKLKPNRRLEYYYNLANALSLKERYQEAVTHYKNAIE